MYKKIKVKITLTEEMLGTSSANPEIHSEYIASKAPDAASREEEVAAIGVDESIEKAMTVFPRDTDGHPFVWDYQIKGWMKDACGMLRRAKGSESSKLTAYKQVIDGVMFPTPRRIRINMPEGAQMGTCERPLRAETAQGPRVALANSETVPEGSTLEFVIKCLPLAKSKTTLDALVMEWLEYGEMRGLGQWRNSGKGRFEFEILE